jgi:hypothetical protein
MPSRLLFVAIFVTGALQVQAVFAAPALAPRLPRLLEAPPGPYDTTTFDLGVDVGGVPLTKQGVNQFLQTLSPEGQYILVSTCRNYLGEPAQVRNPRTLDFCQVLIGG